MTTLLQLIIPAFICLLIWKAFRSPKRSGDPSPGSGCDNSSQSGCGDHGGGSCDGGGNSGGGGD